MIAADDHDNDGAACAPGAMTACTLPDGTRTVVYCPNGTWEYYVIE